MMETDGAVFIDVRTSGEALTYGAPTASLNVPAFTWDGQLMCSVPNFVENVEEQVGGLMTRRRLWSGARPVE